MTTTARTLSSTVAAALVLGLSVILSSWIVAGYVAKIKATGDGISVTGSAQRVITSDVAKWRVQLSRSVPAESTQEGYAALKRDLDALNAYVKKSGIDAKNVTVGAVAVEPGYDYSGGKGVTSYTLRQDVTVEASDVAKVTQTAQNVGTLLAQGALLSTTSLEYFYSKLADVKIEMLAQATENAKQRAEKIAQSAGSQLGGLKDASMGVMQITSVNSTEVSDYGMYDTSSIEKQVTAVVRASFKVN